MTYALLSMSERHGLLAGIMCAGASPVPACAELTQPPAWFFAAVARPCLWAVGVQLPPHLAASASCCVTWRSCCGGSLRRRRPACRGSLASELLSRRGQGGGHVGGPAGKARRPEARHQDGVVLPNLSRFCIVLVLYSHYTAHRIDAYRSSRDDTHTLIMNWATLLSLLTYDSRHAQR